MLRIIARYYRVNNHEANYLSGMSFNLALLFHGFWFSETIRQSNIIEFLQKKSVSTA